MVKPPYVSYWRIEPVMKCPHCQEELPARECPQCGEKIPTFGKFCCYCGTDLADLDAPNPDIDADTESGEGGLDFSKRILCSDGNCIGVINEQGVCSECGKPYKGEEKI